MNHRKFFLVTALLCACVTNAAYAAELITLRYGQNAASTGSLSALPLTVAERKGFFVREGLNLVAVRFPAARTGLLRRWTRVRSTPAKTLRLI